MISGNKSHSKCGGYVSSWNCCQVFQSVASPVTKLLYTLSRYVRVSQILLTPMQYGENENCLVHCIYLKDNIPSYISHMISKSCVRVWTGFIYSRAGPIFASGENGNKPYGCIKGR